LNTLVNAKKETVNTARLQRPNTSSKINEIVTKTLSNKSSLGYDNSPSYTIAVDKLKLSLKDNLFECSFDKKYIQTNYTLLANGSYRFDNIILKQTDELEKTFLYRWELFIENKLIGYLSTDCRRKSTPDLLMFSFFNQVFYISDWNYYLNVILNTLPVKIQTISDFHIAYDSNYDYITDFIKLYFESTVSKSREVAGRPAIYEPMQKKLYVCAQANETGFLIGKNSTGKQVCLYDKTEENKKTKKPHITQFHKQNGLDITKPIYRIELRLKTSYISKRNIKLEDLTTTEGLISLFKQLTEEMLTFNVLASKFYDSNRNLKYTEKISLIDYSQLKTTKVFTKLENYSQPDNTRAINTTFKRIFLQYIQHGKLSDLEYLRTFVRDVNNKLDPNEPNENYCFIQADCASFNKFKEKAKFIKKEYSGKMNDATINRINTIEELIFNVRYNNN